MSLFVIKREGSKCYYDYSKQLKSGTKETALSPRHVGIASRVWREEQPSGDVTREAWVSSQL